MALMDLLRGRPSPAELVKEHGPAVLRQLKRLFGPRADVDDVYQAVFLEVLRSLPRFQGRAKLGTWIHRITLNVAYQEMRWQYRERLSRETCEIEELPLDCDLAERVERAEELRRLYAALEALEPKRRMAVLLHDLEGHTLKQVGELLGRPLQTVASQVRAGRADLARALAPAATPAGEEVSA